MDFKDIDQKWQQKRKDTGIYTVKEDPNKSKFYVLDMFPYPSGSNLHVGHPKGYIASDTLARKKMLEGFNVLHPMGFDTFGLGTETYAIEHKMKPQVIAKQNIDTFIKQLELFGCTYDWNRSFSTADPDYFKWTQRVFLKMYTHYYDEKLKKAMPIESLKLEIENGRVLEGGKLKIEGSVDDYINNKRLAYIDFKPINRCPSCKTGLANEDLDDGKCERCGSDVEQKPMKQRVLRITEYAERLIEGLDTVNRDASMKDLEKNRIGRSEGTQFKMVIARDNIVISNDSEKSPDKQGDSSTKNSEGQLSFEVYTTRIDTVFGMSFVVMAPEHPLLNRMLNLPAGRQGVECGVLNKEEIEVYKELAKKKTQLERTELQKEKTGVEIKGVKAINPFNGQEVPIFVGDYVLANYGTGVVMAVPAHDERDFEFAKKYDLPIVQSIMPDSFDEKNPPREDKEYTVRDTVHVIIRNTKDKTVLVQYLTGEMRGDLHPKHFIIGGIEAGESELETAIREVQEETGYTNIQLVEKVPFEIQANFFAAHKDVNRKIHVNTFVFDLMGDEKIEITEDDHFTKDSHEHHWIPYDKVAETINIVDDEMSWKYFYEGGFAYGEKGVLMNSGQFDGLTTEEAIPAMQARLAENNLGGKKCNYRIQDRVFSRQRYRGEPFPVVICNRCNVKAELSFYDQKTRTAIENKVKTIETRALNPEEPDRYFGNLKVGDIILAVNKETHAEMRLRITKTYQRKNLQEMRDKEDKNIIRKTYSNPDRLDATKDFEDFASARAFTPGYREKIDTNGLIGREVEILAPEIVPMDEKDLPLLLPDVENYEPTGTEEGPLANVEDRINTTCPHCGKPAKRESNTMPGRAGSSRYFLRYMDPKNDKELVSKERESYRKNVDVYVGGAEHVTRHMIYARFWQKFLHDIGVVSQDEPFMEYHSVGLIMGEDGRKMSKRRGNVVNPDDLIALYGADTLRTYEMFMGPFDQSIARSTNGVSGVKKFLDKITLLKDKMFEGEETDNKTIVLLHQTIKKVGEDINEFKFNTAISQLMILVNHLTEVGTLSRKSFESLVILVSPFAPHIAEELWESLGNEYSIFTKATWPTYDPNCLVADEVTIAVQINGKVRGTISLSREADEADAIALAHADEKIKTRITGEAKKVIYVKGKILNIIV